MHYVAKNKKITIRRLYIYFLICELKAINFYDWI